MPSQGELEEGLLGCPDWLTDTKQAGMPLSLSVALLIRSSSPTHSPSPLRKKEQMGVLLFVPYSAGRPGTARTLQVAGRTDQDSRQLLWDLYGVEEVFYTHSRTWSFQPIGSTTTAGKTGVPAR